MPWWKYRKAMDFIFDLIAGTVAIVAALVRGAAAILVTAMGFQPS